MKSSDKLFRLVQSLSKAEKRYFRLYATQQGSKDLNYLHLFDALDKLEAYSDTQLMRQFANEAFTNNLAQTKKYLYDAILRSLKLFFADVCISVKLPDSLKDMRVLLNKGMVKQALKQYQRIEQIYTVNEQYGGLFDVLSFGEQLYRTTLTNGEQLKKVRSIFQQKQMCLQYLNNLNEYIYLRNEIEYAYWAAYPGRSAEAVEGLRSYLDHPLLLQGKRTLSLSAEMAYYESLHLIYLGTSDYRALKASCLEALQLTAGTEMNAYFTLKWTTTVYQRLVTAALYLNDGSFEEHQPAFDNYLTTYKNRVNLLDSINGQLRYHHVLLLRYFRRGQYQKMFHLEQAIAEFLEDYWSILEADTRGEVALLLAQAYTYTGKFETAQHWTERITEVEKEHSLVSQVAWARQLQLILHFHQQHFHLLESLNRSVHRYLKKTDQLHTTERSLLKFLNRVARNQGFETANHQRALRKELSVILKDSHEKRFLLGLNLVRWLDSPQQLPIASRSR